MGILLTKVDRRINLARDIAELDTDKGIGQIEKKRLGLRKPNVIYVKNFMIRKCPEPQDEEKAGENAENTQKYE